jgi:hypothetical protein
MGVSRMIDILDYGFSVFYHFDRRDYWALDVLTENLMVLQCALYI